MTAANTHAAPGASQPVDAARVPPALLGWTLVAYSLLNRGMSDLIVIPGGISISPSQLFIPVVFFVYILSAISEGGWGPRGVPGLAGALALFVVTLGPIVNAATLRPIERRTFDQGLVDALLLTCLFLAAYHAGTKGRDGAIALKGALALSIFQATIGLYEMAVRAPARFLDDFWLRFGLVFDGNNALRSAGSALEQRLTGELRVQATTPHPLVLASILTLGALISMSYALEASTKRKWLHWIAASIQLAAMAATNSRTGFVVLLAGIAVLIWHHAARPLTILRIALSGVITGATAVVAFPTTARLMLNFFTGSSTDHNVDVRQARWSAVPELLAQRPYIGGGYRTFDVTLYLFDNSLIVALLEFGVLGLSLFFAFLATSGVRLQRGARQLPDRVERPVIGFMTVIVLLLSAATYDALAFDQFFPMALILMGIGIGHIDRSTPTTDASVER